MADKTTNIYINSESANTTKPILTNKQITDKEKKDEKLLKRKGFLDDTLSFLTTELHDCVINLGNSIMNILKILYYVVMVIIAAFLVFLARPKSKRPNKDKKDKDLFKGVKL